MAIYKRGQFFFLIISHTEMLPHCHMYRRERKTGLEVGGEKQSSLVNVKNVP